MKLFKTINIIIITLTIALAGCGNNSSQETTEQASGSADEQITLKLASFFADTTTTYTDFVKPWIERVTERTNGKVQIEYYPSEQLGKAGDLLGLTADNVADISMLPTIYYPSEMPINNALQNMPGVAESGYQSTLGFWDLIQENPEILEKEFLANGVRPLGVLNSPPYEIWTMDREIRVPSDLKGLKIKTAGGMSSEFFEFVGAVPVTVPYPEMYEAVERGVVDALSIDGKPLISTGVKDLLTHGVLPHYGTSLQALIINEKVWQGLPDDVKEVMIQAGQEVTEEIGKVENEVAKTFIEEFRANKTIVELTPEEEQEWKSTAEEFQKKWIAENETEDFKISEYLEQYKKSLEKFKE
ncbi:TRAP transporter substrate-binding protein DctP [Bacillus dakarensis]|uniref:TRAP transporter substrate-binding protein DctP n=1 Tax=Robertmurraya dakarensis TaxID=1926278 RepID=UPI000980E5CE|nr:TRAP transporter substrate-binding protein DctP [Bacillus dakarensis]